jgi:hypothetical protein
MAEPLSCPLKHWPATSDLLGKLRLSVQTPDGWIYPRQIREAIEAVEEVPLPAHCGFWAEADGVAVEVLVHKTNAALQRKIGQSLEEQGVPLRNLYLVEDPSHLQHPLPLRSELRESLFDSRWLFEPNKK